MVEMDTQMKYFILYRENLNICPTDGGSRRARPSQIPQPWTEIGLPEIKVYLNKTNPRVLWAFGRPRLGMLRSFGRAIAFPKDL